MPSRSTLSNKVRSAFRPAEMDDDAPADALFDETVRSGLLRRLPLDKVTPRSDQPRQSMDPEALEELTESIRDRGVLQPIRVRPKDGGGYEIIAGERRWTAAARAGLRDIPAVVVTVDDDAAYIDALVENIQREDLNPVDRAQALKRLRVALGRQSWEDVGKLLGIGRQHVHRLLNVTKLPEAIQDDLRAGDLTEKHGRALLTLRGFPAQQMRLWERIKKEDLTGDASVAAAKELRPDLQLTKASSSVSSATPAQPDRVHAAAAQLLELLAAAEPTDLTPSLELLAELRTRLEDALAVAKPLAGEAAGSG